MFGFTGTPILADNAFGTKEHQQTTATLFGDCFHKYVILDAIKDENVLRFAVEYVGKTNQTSNSTVKKKRKKKGANDLDIAVEETDTKEMLESPLRLEKVVDYILEHHAQKTKAPDFTAMFCVSNIETPIKYYELFQKQ
jgi:type I restriction enzyme R subunit